MNRIALIEDHARLATLVSRSLANSGIETDVFHQISTAWLALQDIDYGVIVIDRGLPDGDGLQLVQRLRAAGRSTRSEEHTSELQSQSNIVCRLLLEKKK